MTHADMLELLLSNERLRLAAAKTESERELRSVWVRQLEKEVEFERGFRGIGAATESATELSDDELLQELNQ